MFPKCPVIIRFLELLLFSMDEDDLMSFVPKMAVFFSQRTNGKHIMAMCCFFCKHSSAHISKLMLSAEYFRKDS